MSSRQNPLHLSSCLLWLSLLGGLSLSRVLWKSAYSRSNMKPKSIPKPARKWIEQLFCWFQVLRQHFMFLSCCIYLHACSFHLHASSFKLCIHFLSFPFHVSFIGIHFHSYSFHIPFMFIPMFIHVLSSSFHLHTCSFHFSLMSFHFLSKVVEMALWLGQGTRVQQMVIAKLSPRLSPNNPSNI